MTVFLFGNPLGNSGSTCTLCGWAGPYYRVDGAAELAEADAEVHRHSCPADGSRA